MRSVLLALMVAVIAFPLAALPALAAQQGGTIQGNNCGEFGCFEAPLPGIDEGTSIDQFVNSPKPFTKIVSTLVEFFIGLIVACGLIMIVIGGYVYMTAGGSGDRVSTAKVMIGSALLGIILALGSYLILNTISPQFFQEPTISQNTGGVPPGVNPASARIPAVRLNNICAMAGGNCTSGSTDCQTINDICG